MSKKRRITDEEMDALCDYLESDQDWYEAAKVFMDDEDLYSEYLYMCASKIAFHLENEGTSHEAITSIFKALEDSSNKQARDAIWSSVFSRQYQSTEWREIGDGMIHGLKLNQGLRTQSDVAKEKRAAKSEELLRSDWIHVERMIAEFSRKEGRPAFSVDTNGKVKVGFGFWEYVEQQWREQGIRSYRPSDKRLVRIITKFCR